MAEGIGGRPPPTPRAGLEEGCQSARPAKCLLLLFHFAPRAPRPRHSASYILFGIPVRRFILADEPAHRCLKYAQTALPDLGRAQPAFFNPSIDSPLAHLQQLGCFLNSQQHRSMIYQSSIAWRGSAKPALPLVGTGGRRAPITCPETMQSRSHAVGSSHVKRIG
jgi:hypothetical protein